MGNYIFPAGDDKEKETIIIQNENIENEWTELLISEKEKKTQKEKKFNIPLEYIYYPYVRHRTYHRKRNALKRYPTTRPYPFPIQQYNDHFQRKAPGR
jgi:hypothetical protein